MNRLLLRQFKSHPKFVHFKHSDAFSKAKCGTFYQDEPKITNQFKEDAYLREYLALSIPKEVRKRQFLFGFLYKIDLKHLKDIEEDLDQFGEQVANNILKLHFECEKNPPYLEQYDGWGKRYLK